MISSLYIIIITIISQTEILSGKHSAIYPRALAGEKNRLFLWTSGQDDWLVILHPRVESPPADGDYLIPVETELEALSVRLDRRERTQLNSHRY